MRKEQYIIEPELIWALYWGEELSTIDIAKLFGCDCSTIASRMKKFDIEIKNCNCEQYRKGSIPWNRGKKNPYSKETLKQMSKSQTGKKLTEETKEKMRKVIHKSDCKCITCKTHRGEYNNFGENNPTFGIFKFNITKEDLYKYYIVEYMSLTDISKIFNCSSELIRKKIKKYGISLKKPWEGRKNNLLTLQRYGERRALSKKSELWRKQVFKRDNYMCQFCFNGTGGNLNAHHIKSWKNYPNDRFNIDNGITLCESCHTWLHTLIPIQYNPMN